ncbi:glyoxylate/hydroxypyruvate reductase A [Planctobacterium marinum]|uniref:Glyoxylate/hydroxypyruvate reductase A n=2 Tax=Planctobacterium marinum TaxID=1631968 RepID=A0AA48HCZ4_9ALTE|nr:glyoxylate/hydroxypyruvate reductase A [Planctobacterium marinum]
MPEHQFKVLSELSDSEKSKIEVAIVANTENTDFTQLPHLKWVQSTWAGVENLLDCKSLLDVPIVRLQDPTLANTMADSVLCWVMNCQRHNPLYARQQKTGHWQSHPVKPNQEFEILLLGAGNMGMTAARRLQEQGYKLSIWARTTRDSISDDVIFYSDREGLRAALQRADVVVALLPHTPDTRFLLDDETLSWCKPGAYLINFGRGSAIKTSALLTHLERSELAHAVLDVFDVEPLPQDHPFWHHPKVTVLPHIAAPTNPQSATLVIKKNLSNYISFGQIPKAVDIKRGY